MPVNGNPQAEERCPQSLVVAPTVGAKRGPNLRLRGKKELQTLQAEDAMTGFAEQTVRLIESLPLLFDVERRRRILKALEDNPCQ